MDAVDPRGFVDLARQHLQAGQDQERAATRHKATFLAEYKADANAVPTGSLPIALRIGTTKPDWRTPEKATLSTDWKDMEVPGNWESRGLEDFDGVVWFTRTIEAPQGAGEMTLSLGRISNTADGIPAPFDNSGVFLSHSQSAQKHAMDAHQPCGSPLQIARTSGIAGDSRPAYTCLHGECGRRVALCRVISVAKRVVLVNVDGQSDYGAPDGD